MITTWQNEKLLFWQKLLGFQTMMILDPYGMTFDAVGVFCLAFHLLFKSSSSCETCSIENLIKKNWAELSWNLFLNWIGTFFWLIVKTTDLSVDLLNQFHSFVRGETFFLKFGFDLCYLLWKYIKVFIKDSLDFMGIADTTNV